MSQTRKTKKGKRYFRLGIVAVVAAFVLGLPMPALAGAVALAVVYIRSGRSAKTYDVAPAAGTYAVAAEALGGLAGPSHGLCAGDVVKTWLVLF